MRKTIFGKILASFIVIVLLIAIQGFIAYNALEKNSRLERKIQEANQLHSFLIEREVDHHLWMIRLYDMFAGGPIPAEIRSHEECNLGQWYHSYEPTDYNRELYEALDAPHEKLHKSSRQVVEFFRQGRKEEAITLFRTETIPAVEGVRENLHKLKELEMQHVAELEQEMEILDRQIIGSVIIGTVVSLIIALILAFILTRIIAKPLKNITEIAERIAAGDLTGTVNIKRQDEIGKLASSFNIMIDKLRGLVKDISEKSQFVVDASSQLRAVSADTGKASEEIATSISQVASGSENIAKQVDALEKISQELSEDGKMTFDGSNETLEAAKESEEAAQRGWDAVKKAIDQLNVVTDTVKFASEAIQKLGKRSSQIGEMTEMIQGIASQTNLLALNAAIEAARAGEHGKGFAVVAEEVRKLAEESSQAAGKITSLIEDIEAETTVTVQSMDVNTEQVKEQVKIINEAGDSLQRIVKMAQETRLKTQNINEIASKVRESSSKMIDAIQSIAAVIEQNAANSEEVSAAAEEQNASVEELAAAADELQTMAEELEALIKEFDIEEGEDNETKEDAGN